MHQFIDLFLNYLSTFIHLQHVIKQNREQVGIIKMATTACVSAMLLALFVKFLVKQLHDFEIMKYCILFYFVAVFCLQCFDTVGWVAGRASSL